MSITDKRLTEIRERLDAATPGPWMPDNDEPGYVIAPDDPSGWDGYLIASTVDRFMDFPSIASMSASRFRRSPSADPREQQPPPTGC